MIVKAKKKKENPLDKMYHVCRWCKFFVKGDYYGYCRNNESFSLDKEGYYNSEHTGIENPDTYYCSEWS